jgi:hypothetical protein
MTCKVKADPKPSLSWTKEGKMVLETSRVSISVTEESEFVYNIKLTIKVGIIAIAWHRCHKMFND